MKQVVLLAWLILGLSACAADGKENVHSGQSPSYLEIPNNSIINLYDAFGEDHEELQKDFGFSCIVKYNGTTILFDAGSNADIFKNNVEALKIDLKEIDFAIASHSHFDHINGFDYLLEINPDVKIYFPFDPFWGANFPFDLGGQEPTVSDSLEKKMQYFGGEYDSFHFDQTGRFWNANIDFVKEDQEISPGIKLLCTSSPYLGYFVKYPTLGIDETELSMDVNESDGARYIELPEISLSLSTGKGEILIVGCSHSTVETIIAKAKATSDDEIEMVYGGYHLLPYDKDVLEDLAMRLKSEFEVKRIAPAHCTGHLAFKVLSEAYGDDYVFAGLGETTSIGN